MYNKRQQLITQHSSLRTLFDSDAWSEILDALGKNRLRSFLTAFGIFWGIFMLVLLMGGGRGLQSLLTQQFSGFASNAGFAGSGQTSMPYAGFSEGRRWNLTLTDLEVLRQSIPQLDVVSAQANSWGINAKSDDRQTSVGVTGITPDYQRVSDPRLKHGRKLNDTDMAQRRKVCVVGSRVAQELFPGRDDICGEHIMVNDIDFTIVGQSGRSGGINIGGNAENAVEMPLSTFQQLFGYGNIIGLVAYTVRSGYQVSQVQQDVRRTLYRRHHIHPADEQAMFLLNTEAMFQMMDSIFQGIGILVWMIGIGTLLGGGIGVSNIMMVAVRERTTEIGIRRAIGATPRAIMRQILSESMLLTLLAGMSGICAAVGILALIEKITVAQQVGDDSTSFVINFWVALGAALAVALIGLLAGLAPALRAMRIRPVEAMRSDE